ncbi:unnamed protein product, partial [Prorocentrum cordatum]
MCEALSFVAHVALSCPAIFRPMWTAAGMTTLQDSCWPHSVAAAELRSPAVGWKSTPSSVCSWPGCLLLLLLLLRLSSSCRSPSSAACLTSVPEAHRRSSGRRGASC